MKNVCVQGCNYYIPVLEWQLRVMGLDQEPALLRSEQSEKLPWFADWYFRGVHTGL